MRTGPILRLGLLTSFACLCHLSVAQQEMRNYLPISVPVSPEASTLLKAINYPVNYNTGVPDITIPIFELKSRAITFPLTLSYHAGGFKAKEVAAVTGLGWNLSANLQIVREVHGLDDFSRASNPIYNGYYYNNYGQTESYRDESLYTSQRIFEMAAGKLDTQPDHFYYNILGKSGSFYLSKNKNTRDFYTFPYSGLHISCVPKSSTSPEVQFRITDTDGTQYNFTIGECIHDPNYQQPSYENSWKCTSIVSPDKTDTIHIAYERLTNLYSYVGNEFVELYEDLNGVQGQSYLPYGGTIFVDQVETKAQHSYTTVLNKFRFFNLSVPRAINHSLSHDKGLILYTKDGDIGPWSTKTFFGDDFPLWQMPKRIQERYVVSTMRSSNYRVDFFYNDLDQLFLMKIADSRNNLLENVYFDQSTVGNYISMEHTNRTNYLDALRLQGPKGNTLSYQFEYTSKYAFGNDTKGGDLWGGVNSSTINRDSYSEIRVPGFSLLTKYYRSNHYADTDTLSIWVGGFSGTDPIYQWMESQYALLGHLKKIVYPTNGYTEFDFGPHYGCRLDVPWAAFQVGGVRINEISNYESDGTLLSRKVYQYGEDGSGIPNGLYDYTSETSNKPFYYKQEVEYFYNPQFTMNHVSTTARDIVEMKTTYVANALEDLHFSNGSPIYYEKVTEYDYSDRGENGKKEYIYTAPDRFGLFLHNKLEDTNLLRFKEDWRMGRLEKENTYRSIGAQQYQLIHSVKYDYDVFQSSKGTGIDMPYRKRIIMGVYDEGPNSYSHSEITDASKLMVLDPGNYVSLYSQVAYTGAVQPVRKTETIYDGTQGMEVVIEYEYDSFFQIHNTTVTYPDGSKDNTSVWYANNLSGDIPFIQNMKSRNQIGVPVKIEKSTSRYNGNHTVEGIIRNFCPDNPALVEKVYAFGSNGGNGSSSSGSDPNVPNGYYPKASFSYDDQDCLVETLMNETLKTVYLWGYDNQYLIAEIENADYKTVCDILGTSVVRALRSSYDSSYIREQIQSLREDARMRDALVRTFIHAPAIGMIEVVAPNGVKTSYTYDEFRRLEKVKDHNGCPINSYEYYYYRK